MEVMDVLMSLTTTCMPVYVSILYTCMYANKVHYTLIACMCMLFALRGRTFAAVWVEKGQSAVKTVYMLDV
jgi:hypothetical protein